MLEEPSAVIFMQADPGTIKRIFGSALALRVRVDG